MSNCSAPCAPPPSYLFPETQQEADIPSHLAACHGTLRDDPAAAAPPPDAIRMQQPAGARTGIAGLAGSSPRASQKRGTEYFLLPVRSILNHCTSDRVPFEWTINPYRGCEFGCRYCYARYTHEFMELDGGEFESKIFVKQNAGPILARDLAGKASRLQASHSAAEPGRQIAIGTATDPYQPAEREYRVTRALLEQLADREGLDLSITTKSNLILRDLDLLARIAKKSSLAINLTITTLRPRLARLLEPRAPRPDLRLAAVRALRQEGLRAGVFAMPVLPGLTDRDADLEALARAASEAGAQWLAGGVLFLMPAALKEFLPFLEDKFPKLVKGYRKWYLRNAYAPEAYRRKISARFAALRSQFALDSRPRAAENNCTPPAPQLQLLLDVSHG